MSLGKDVPGEEGTLIPCFHDTATPYEKCRAFSFLLTPKSVDKLQNPRPDNTKVTNN